MKNIIKLLCGVFTSISIIAIATIVSLNFTFIYEILIEKYNLVQSTGVSKGNLIINYRGLVEYLNNPFIKKLKLPDFKMSLQGEIHFMEVKRIFQGLFIIAIVFIVMTIVYIIIGQVKNRKLYIERYINNLNYSSNILISFFVMLVIAYFIDFSKAFILFHKIFFRNDYWVFDEKTDPIINALPQDLFMIYGGIILVIIAMVAIGIKVISKKYIGKDIAKQ